MKTSLELRVFLKHLAPEYRHAARVAYWIGAGDAIKATKAENLKLYRAHKAVLEQYEALLAQHEADHPEAGTPFKSGRTTRRKPKRAVK